MPGLSFLGSRTQPFSQIIIRARHTYLIDQLNSESSSLTEALISQASQARSTYLSSKLLKHLTPNEHPQTESSADVDAIWALILSKESSDEKWWSEAKAADEKFTMHIASLVRCY